MEENNTNKQTTDETGGKESKAAEVDYKAEFERLKDENEKLKKATTNASADVSRLKKELAARMSDDERTKAEQAEATAALQKELDMLRRDKSVSEHTASFLGIGFDNELAKASAEAITDGNTAALFENLKKFVVAHDKAINADAIRNTPKPSGSAVGEKVTKEQFDKMGYSERVKLFDSDPDLYKELSK